MFLNVKCIALLPRLRAVLCLYMRIQTSHQDLRYAKGQARMNAKLKITGHFLSPLSPTVNRLSTANPFELLWNLYLLNQQHPRPFYGLCYCNRSPIPQYLMYFILSTPQFHSPYFTARTEAWRD